MKTDQQGWKQRQRPPRLERRIDFEDYEQTRAFLEALADLSEATDLYPDISFGRTYVNLSIQAEVDATEMTSEHGDLAQRIDALIAPAPMPC